jgi:hypothetical protein
MVLVIVKPVPDVSSNFGVLGCCTTRPETAKVRAATTRATTLVTPTVLTRLNLVTSSTP